ncbi:Bromodomain-containing protein [Blyttiomyces helicus]|uniref:Bromodomain-containing protein n=1 Tax=Blyttiomyces helicus TaxID=388810 RepID=A0A4P9WAB9_9FUNG|nr:Bromodomain-containing protein [Blyttiomyces helicus]|eukprot:RKO88495.1 Bromodomain-containing protein [Blyttiomyces helicus]
MEIWTDTKGKREVKAEIPSAKSRASSPGAGDDEGQRKKRGRKSTAGIPRGPYKRKATEMFSDSQKLGFTRISLNANTRPTLPAQSSPAMKSEPSHQPLKISLRIPTISAPAPPTSTSPDPPVKKKRANSLSLTTAANYLQGPSPKSYGRRRSRPEVDLQKILDGIVCELIAVPEAWEFCRPVSHAVKDYYEIVKKPKTLEQIRDDVKDCHYANAQAFLADVQLIASNSRLYNGPAHPRTVVAEQLVARAQGILAQHNQELVKIESDIVESASQIAAPPSLTFSTSPPMMPQALRASSPPPQMLLTQAVMSPIQTSPGNGFSFSPVDSASGSGPGPLG